MLSMLLLTLAAAGAPAKDSAAQPAAPMTLQQKFDKASQDFDQRHCAEALAGFRSIESDPHIRAGSVPAAAIALRKGVCLARTGSPDEGQAAIATGIPILEKAGAQYAGDVAMGWLIVGDLAYRGYDFAYATKAYKRALANSQGDFRLEPLVRLAKATTFDGTPEALSYSEEALKILSAQPKPNKIMLASVHTLHARTLSNQGKASEAYKEMKTALSLSGGLSTAKVSLTEVALRSDLAMAALQNGQKDDARLYLAYTGAGRITQSPFASALSMDPPLCGSETGLRPEDVAVVEFSLTDQGTVDGAQTVYSRGGPQVAAAFGKAVREWQWKPEDVAKIPSFYRSLTRVELRCSNALGSGPGIMGPVRERYATWMTNTLAKAGQPARNMEDTARLAADAAMVPEVRIAALGSLADADTRTPEARIAAADQAMALAPGKVPPEVITWLRLTRASAANDAATRGPMRRRAEMKRASFLSLAADPAFTSDALAADTAVLLATQTYPAIVMPEDVERLKRVGEDGRLPEQHPLRQLAWLQLADRAASAKDFATAQGYFAKSGLSTEQCSLLGVTPTLRKTGADSNDYPTEALTMGFEGWVRLEFDINADGRTANARPLVAYPPFVFVDAALSMTRDVRYQASYRPGTDNACNADRETIRFVIPSAH